MEGIKASNQDSKGRRTCFCPSCAKDMHGAQWSLSAPRGGAWAEMEEGLCGMD